MAVIVFILNLIVGLLVTAVYLCKKTFGYWKVRGVPNIEPHFLYGNSKGLGSKYHTVDLVQRVYKELKNQGSFGGIHIGFRPTAIIMDLDLIATVLVKDFHYFPNRGIYYNPADDPISEHISNIENDKWKNIRSKLTPTFTSGKLKVMFDTILELTESLINTIDRETATGNIDIKEMMARFTCDVIGNVALGIECGSLKNKNSKFFEMAVKSMDSFDFVQRLLLMGHKKLARFFHMKLTPEDVSKFYKNVVKSIIGYRSHDKDVNRADLMNILIAMMMNDDITINQVAAQSFFYFVAGYETTSTTLTFCIYELSQNQEIQEEARQEVIKVLSKHQNKLTYEAVSDLEFIDTIVKETLRMWPPSVTVQREAAVNYKVPNTNFIVERGCAIIVPVYGIHHDPEIYPEPEKFDPTRFNHDEVAKRHPFSFLPFGEGPRGCPGVRFSYLETKTAMAKLLMTYQFSMDYDLTELPIKISPTSFMLSPQKKIFVKFNKF